MQNTFLPLILIGIFLTGKCFADESWGDHLFQTKNHNFGNVALGANAEYRFEITNTYNHEVRLLNVQSSCGCTAAKLTANVLQPGETGMVIARFNTSGQHLREKSAVLTVQMQTVINGRGISDTVQLFVTGYIRPDVVLTPGSVEFGSVSEGETATRTVQLNYSGQPNWALTKIERSQPFIHARAEEVKRNEGEVSYRMTVTLKENAPVGYIKEVLRFATNEISPGKSEPVEIILPVQGVVTPVIHAKPSPMLIGILSPGETVAKNIIVRSETPFRITNVTAADKRFRFAFSDRESNVQLISVSFSARDFSPNGSPPLSEAIQISTDNVHQRIITVDAVVRIRE